MKNTKKFFACDDANKGLHVVVKLVAFWSKDRVSTFLLDSSTRATKTRDRLELNITLGTWFHSARKFFDRYENFYSPTNRAIYIFYREYSFFQKHNMIQRRNRDDSIKYFDVRPSSTITALPIDAVPTNPIFSNTAISATTNLTYPCRIDKEATSWEEFLSQQTTWEKDILQTINHLDLQTLLDRIMIGQSIYICSDGGANNKTGSFAAVLATDERILVVLSGVVQGESPGSFRAEAVGMLSPLHYLQKLRQFYKLEHIPSIYQYTDSDSLIKRIQERIKYIPCSA